MPLENAYDLFEKKADEARQWFGQEISQLRTGRVKASLIEDLPVEHYGVRTPLKGVASLSNSDARTLVVAPWDPTAIPTIEKAITQAQLGVNPVVDGKVIRLSFPMLTSEIREQTIKQLHKKAEEARVRLRLARDESLHTLKTERATSTITEDDFYEGREQLDKRIDKRNQEIATMVSKKEEEIKTI